MIAVLPEILVVPFDKAVVIVFGVSNPEHPRYFASPNAYSFPSLSSSVELAAEVFAGSSIAVLPNDAPCSHSSSPRVCLHKKMERFDSSPNLNCSNASDTSVLPTDATTSHRRKRCPHLSQGLCRHSFPAALPYPVVLQIRWAAAEKY